MMDYNCKDCMELEAKWAATEAERDRLAAELERCPAGCLNKACSCLDYDVLRERMVKAEAERDRLASDMEALRLSTGSIIKSAEQMREKADRYKAALEKIASQRGSWRMEAQREIALAALRPSAEVGVQHCSCPNYISVKDGRCAACEKPIRPGKGPQP